MSLDTQTELTRVETDALLGEHETGVLSLAREDEPYAVPISYGYDVKDQRFYLRLVSTPESEKRRFLRTSPNVTLVVYEEGDSVYRSVIATGTLEEIQPEELTVEDVEQYGEAKRPLFEVWGTSKPSLNVRLYQLTPDSVSGRRIEVERTTDPA